MFSVCKNVIQQKSLGKSPLIHAEYSESDDVASYNHSVSDEVQKTIVYSQIATTFHFEGSLKAVKGVVRSLSKLIIGIHLKPCLYNAHCSQRQQQFLCWMWKSAADAVSNEELTH